MSPEAASILAGAVEFLASAVTTAAIIISAAALAKPVVVEAVLYVADRLRE